MLRREIAHLAIRPPVVLSSFYFFFHLFKSFTYVKYFLFLHLLKNHLKVIITLLAMELFFFSYLFETTLEIFIKKKRFPKIFI